jgi:hypothetical protein
MGFRRKFYIPKKSVNLIFAMMFASSNSHAISETNAKTSYKPVAEKNLECKILFSPPKLDAENNIETQTAVIPSAPVVPPAHLLEQTKDLSFAAPPVINVSETLDATPSNLLKSTTYVDQLFQIKTSDLQKYIQRLSLTFVKKSTQGLDAQNLDNKVHQLQMNLQELTQVVESSNPGFFSGFKPQAHSIEKQFLTLQKSFQESPQALLELSRVYQNQLAEYENLLPHEQALQEHLTQMNLLHGELIKKSGELHLSQDFQSEKNLNLFFIEPLTSLISQTMFQKSLLDSRILQMYQELQMSHASMQALKEFITIHWPAFLDQHQDKLQKLLPKTLSKGNWEKFRFSVKATAEKTSKFFMKFSMTKDKIRKYGAIPDKSIPAIVTSLIMLPVIVGVNYTAFERKHNEKIDYLYSNYDRVNRLENLPPKNIRFKNTDSLDVDLKDFFIFNSEFSIFDSGHSVSETEKKHSFINLMKWLQDKKISLNTSSYILESLDYFKNANLDAQNIFSDKTKSEYPGILSLIITTLEHTDASLTKDAPFELIREWAQAFEISSFKLIDQKVQDNKISKEQSAFLKKKIHSEFQRILTPKKSFMDRFVWQSESSPRE